MKKVKISKNDKVIAFEFYSDILKFNMVSSICKLFQLPIVYVDIYTVDVRKKDFYKHLIANNIVDKVSCSPNRYLQDVYVKVAIENIPIMTDLLSQFQFEEFNVWDCYLEWELYLKDKNAKMPFFTFKKTKDEHIGKFYLNYKEGKVEIICDRSYNDQEILRKLNYLINE